MSRPDLEPRHLDGSPTGPSPAGAVLTGGRSRRFGRDKAIEPVDGRAMAARVAAALEGGGCHAVVTVGGDVATITGVVGVADGAAIEDRWPGAGPLGGVLTALATLDGDVVVAACDLADLATGTVAAVIAAGAEPGVDVAVAMAHGRHVALARWNRSGREVLEARFALGERSWRGVFDHVRTVAVPVDPATVADIDTVADLERRRRARERADSVTA